MEMEPRHVIAEMRRLIGVWPDGRVSVEAADLAAILDAAEALAASVEVQPIYHGIGVEVALARWRELA